MIKHTTSVLKDLKHDYNRYATSLAFDKEYQLG